MPRLFPRQLCGLQPMKFTRLVATTCLIMLLVLISLPYKLRVKTYLLVFGPSWQHFDRLGGYSSGLRNLVAVSELVEDTTYHDTLRLSETILPLEDQDIDRRLIEFDPYSHHTTPHHLSNHHVVQKCFLDQSNAIETPKVYSYLGVPQHHPDPLHGSYKVLGLRDDICFDRFGRFGAYGFESKSTRVEGGPQLEQDRINFRASTNSQIHWDFVDWSDAQQGCHNANEHRFRSGNTSAAETTTPESDGLRRIPKSAVILRTWTGFDYTPQIVINIRALLSEVALGSGGEYDVHLLVHVKDNSVAFWDSRELYDRIVADNVPQEFQGLITLWSEKQMEVIYPGPFRNNTANPSRKPIHGVHRSPHMALQHFAQTHTQYEFFWNWEMDVRYTGHYYELFDRLGRWSREQARRGLWERSAKYFIEHLHGSWEQYTETVQQENEGNSLVWGPVPFPGSHAPTKQGSIWPPRNTTKEADGLWGVGEEADLITLAPLFDPDDSGWYFERDITGYDWDLPLPPRRASIITSARLSRRLLHRMHEEMLQYNRTMWTEMWSPSLALHSGFKAVFAPHPVYYDRKWPAEFADKVFNGGKYGSSGGNASSVFGAHQHNHLESTWYHNARFAGRLWRSWLGGDDGDRVERGVERTSRDQMCLRSMLLHPVKFD